MPWTAPVDRSTGYVVTANDWNLTGQDDLTFLAGSTGQTISTAETTASTTYTNLTTSGPAVTLSTGAHAIVIVSGLLGNNTGADQSWMSFAISGATTLAAADGNGALYQAFTANASGTVSAITYMAITAGSNTFTAKYRVSAGTGTFSNRSITVIPLP